MIAFHLDLKTIHYRMDYLAGLFPRLAAAGYTHVCIELEEKVKLDALAPAAWCEAWSKEEFATILGQIRQAGMAAIPLIQTLGHLEFALSHAAHHELRELDSSAYQLCPSKPGSLAFVKRYMDEVLELFDHPSLVHVGADEAWSLGQCEQCAGHAARTSKSDLFLGYMAKVFDHALSKNARPIAWADMLLANNDAVDNFSRDAIWMDWDYWSVDQGPQRVAVWPQHKHGDPDLLTPEFCATPMGQYAKDDQGNYRPWFYTDYLLDKGFDVIIAPATRSSGDHVFAPALRHMGNVMSGVNRLKQDKKPMGMLVTSWAVRLNHLETQWPMFHLPQVAKEQDKTLWRDMSAAITKKTFGTEAPEFFEAWENIWPVVAIAEAIPMNETAIHYNGSIDSMPYFLDKVEQYKAGGLAAERKKIADQLPAYVKGIEQINALADKLAGTLTAAGGPADNLTLRHWQFAAKAIHARAQEELLFIDSHQNKPDKALAAQYILRLEAQQDEYRALLLETCTPASMERELSMVFATPWRHLMRLAR